MPDKTADPVQIDQTLTAQYGTVPTGFERRRLPSRGATVNMDIQGMDKAKAVGRPSWTNSPAYKKLFPKVSKTMNYDFESVLVVEAASRDLVVQALADAGLTRGKGWLNKNLKTVAQSTTIFAVDFPTVRQTLAAVEKLLEDDRIDFAEISMSAYREPMTLPTDPLVSDQYYFDNPFPKELILGRKQDHGLSEAYDLGFTGEGVTVGVLEFWSFSYQAFTDEVAEMFRQEYPDHTDPFNFNGLYPSHEDLIVNHNQELSQLYDAFTTTYEYGHANAVAGLIAATPNNGLGGSGVAYNADLVGLKNGFSFAQAEAFLWNVDKIDILNNSWGYPTLAGFLTFAGAFSDSIADGGGYQFSTAGRALRSSVIDYGVIQVMAAGNSGIWSESFTPASINKMSVDFNSIITAIWGEVEVDSDDGVTVVAPEPSGTDTRVFADTWIGIGGRTEYDSLAKWREVLAITAVGEDNRAAGYTTTGTNVIASAYSQGMDNVLWLINEIPEFADRPRGIVTLDAYDGFASTDDLSTPDDNEIGFPTDDPALDGYQIDFGGTSAAAPIASGIIALMLEANPDLTTRDIKHILQATSDWTRIPGVLEDLSYKTYASPTQVWGRWPNTLDPVTYSTMWQVNSAFKVHSDQYGFGIIDAEAAVQSATTFPGAPPLTILDTGPVELEMEIENPEFIETGELTASVDISSLTMNFVEIACIRPNIRIEEVELTLTVEGAGPGDLLIGIQSGTQSYSTFAYPRIDGSVVDVDGQNYAYYKYKFNSLKHWGELSGGSWILYVADMAPEETIFMPGEEDPKVDAVISFPPGTTIGLDTVYEDKKVVEMQLRIYGTSTNEEPYALCPLADLTCPGDLDGDGNVTPEDLMIFINWYTSGSFLADFNLDGFVDYLDLLAFWSAWIPGPCGGSTGFPDAGGGVEIDDPDVIVVG